MEIFNIYTERFNALKEQIEPFDEDFISSKEGARLLFNLIYAGLGAGTLFLRLGTIILINRYLETQFQENSDGAFNKLILEKMKDKSISDGDWKDLWFYAKDSLLEDKHQLIKKLQSINDKELTEFVKVRNNIVHAGRKVLQKKTGIILLKY